MVFTSTCNTIHHSKQVGITIVFPAATGDLKHDIIVTLISVIRSGKVSSGNGPLPTAALLCYKDEEAGREELDF